MFSMGAAKGVSVASSFLPAGIHKVRFTGMNLANAGESNVVEFKFESVDGSGIHNERIFEPRSSERTTSQFGENPSEAEQFTLKISQIISALDPELAKKIDENGDRFQAPDFPSFVNLLKKYLDNKVGTETYIKLVPSGNYVNFPRYIASINKDGVLYINNKFIGNNLALTAKEARSIEEASRAKPTSMAEADDEIDEIKNSFKDAKIDDEMPF
jgi:hypothetical protein